ncbi:hypothetical protein G6F24_014347 [Rhizopus arrhizus]|nr:hypothetical protein G6F24_014347 [Rhizopus arrhizus]
MGQHIGSRRARDQAQIGTARRGLRGVRLQRCTGRVQVDLLLAELQRSAAGAETHDLHAKHALIEVTAALDVGNGEDQMVEAVDEDHARSLTLRALPGCAASGRWRCRSRRASPGIHARLSRRCGPSATGQAWR